MKGSVGTSLKGKMIFIKERKLSKKKIKKMARIKGNNRIVTEHPLLDKIAMAKRLRENRKHAVIE